MATIPKKVINQINKINIIHDIIKNQEGHKDGNIHWTDYPPDTWHKHEVEKYDLLCEYHNAYNKKIIDILLPDSF